MLMSDLSVLCFLHPVCSSTQPFQPPPAGPSLTSWVTNVAVSSSIQSASVAASSMFVPPNQGIGTFVLTCMERLVLLIFAPKLTWRGKIDDTGPGLHGEA
jgi:hypothetical protein